MKLIGHIEQMRCNEVWMEAGSSKNSKFLPVKQVYANMAPELSHNLIVFHALSGCDNTSFIASHSNKTMWQVSNDYHELLCGLEDGDLTQDQISSAEAFICTHSMFLIMFIQQMEPDLFYFL